MKSLEPGSSFAGYRIVRRIGAGGMGTMYLAHDNDLDRPVALKLLENGVAETPETRARFLQEAKTIAGLDHPNIVSIHARGESGDQLWIAMQYVEGSDASQFVRTGTPMPPERAVAIISETAAALDFAHARGVLHRDVKPANILLARDSGRVLLADFGIAKEMDKTGILTSTGLVVASLQYAAPEQLDPALRLDRRVDVYALGATLYHLLTGLPPYLGTLAQIVNGHLNAPVPVPSAYGAAPAFDPVIARAMAKRRDDRFRACGELAVAAQDALRRSVPVGPPQFATPPGADDPTRVSAAPQHISVPTRIGDSANPGTLSRATWTGGSDLPAKPRGTLRLRWTAIAAAGILVLIVAIAAFLGLRDRTSDGASSHAESRSATTEVNPGKTQLTLRGRDLGTSTNTFGPCTRTADTASVTASFQDETVLAFVIINGELSLLEVTNPSAGIDLELAPGGATLDIAGDIITIDGQFTPDDTFTVVANCPITN